MSTDLTATLAMGFINLRSQRGWNGDLDSLITAGVDDAHALLGLIATPEPARTCSELDETEPEQMTEQTVKQLLDQLETAKAALRKVATWNGWAEITVGPNPKQIAAEALEVLK